jgi:hypothetical protein
VQKTLIPVALAACALAVPVAAGAKGKPEGAGQAPVKSQATHGNSHKCKPHSVGYVVKGTLVTYGLTQSAGADTPADKSDDRYSGTLAINVTHTNHHAKALSGAQTVTLTNVRVTTGDGVAQPPAAGTQVQLIGKVTKVSKKCTDQSAAGTVTYRKVVFKAPETPDTPQG